MSHKARTVEPNECGEEMRSSVWPHSRTIVLFIVFGCSFQLSSQTHSGQGASNTSSEAFREALSHGNRNEPLSIQEVEAAFARDGNLEAQQKILCDISFAKEPSDRYKALVALKEVGGWFALHQLSEFLTDTPSNTKITGTKGSDQLFASRQFYSAKFLSEIEAQAPIHPSDTDLLSRSSYWAREWKEWIKKNEPALSRIDPSDTPDIPSEHECSERFGKYQRYTTHP